MEQDGKNDLEGRILYFGPPEKAKETKDFVKEMLKTEMIEVRPAVYNRNPKRDDFKIKVRAENKDGFAVLGNKDMLIAPNSKDYRISSLRRRVGEEGVKIRFVDLVEGKIAFYYKYHDVILFRDYTDEFGD